MADGVVTSHVAYAVDVQGQGAAQFCDQLLVSVASLRKAAKWPVVCHVFYGNIPAELALKLVALGTDTFKIDIRRIAPQDLLAMQQYSREDPTSTIRTWSGIVFARVFLPLIMPDVDRVVYIDADTLVRGDIAELYGIDLKGNPIGMNMGIVPEYGYNAGVIVMDLAALRAEDGFRDRLKAFMDAHSKTFKLYDQTTLNRFFAGRITEIGREWNFPPTPGATDAAMPKAKLLHFYNQSQKPKRLPQDDIGKTIVEWWGVLREIDEETRK